MLNLYVWFATCVDQCVNKRPWRRLTPKPVGINEYDLLCPFFNFSTVIMIKARASLRIQVFTLFLHLLVCQTWFSLYKTQSSTVSGKPQPAMPRPTGSHALAVTDLDSLLHILSRSRERHARYTSHLFFLNSCCTNNVIPRGMSLKFPTSALLKDFYCIWIPKTGLRSCKNSNWALTSQ